MNVWLQPLSSAAALEVLRVDRFPFLIGRGPDCDGRVPFAFVSRRHCQVDRVGDQLVVRDLESFNGTYVNGRRADRPEPIANGDELTVGPVAFRVHIPRADRETRYELPRTGTISDPGPPDGA
jgi:pSer/pThr/pTyr-binding forkhead associated (FHA) protein